ncbi:GNAT family N-acetyltransferase [Tropicibacter oceani]|uniref:GNAT family N-acetyltransferase n=1 Tax=Tropicibacter oceani TaxID=3058420 RepID=A0ABY8QI03_9RHOB|nr:GNAT family N-acetyltransferase [Tropicibacter oceani]WGW03417.1 GNAT family N-acetyltransferase [Tropicibacter oceani]
MSVELKHLGPGDSDWLVHQHRHIYARDEGFDDSFGDLVAQILRDFEASHDPAYERGFLAWEGGQRLGSVFCVRVDAQTAKLRLFLLVPQARGKGLGRRMLAESMEFARSKGYERMVLWTHESHRAACALYAAAGWRLTRSEPVHSFGVDLVEQSWEVDL